MRELDAIVAQLKDSVASARRVLSGWTRRPMFERREGRTYALDEFRDLHRAHLGARHAEVAEGGAEIARLLAATARTLLVPKGGTPSWAAYVEDYSQARGRGRGPSLSLAQHPAAHSPPRAPRPPAAHRRRPGRRCARLRGRRVRGG